MSDFEIQIIETAVLAAIVVGVKLVSRSSVNRLLNKILKIVQFNVYLGQEKNHICILCWQSF